MRPEQFEEFKELIEEIQDSPGERVLNEIESIQRSLRLVSRNKVEVVEALTTLENPQAFSRIASEDQRHVLDGLQDEVARRLHNFLSAAFGLVDHFRRHRSRLYRSITFDDEIQREVNRRFVNDADHNIAQGLRTFALHVGIVPITTTFTGTRKGAELDMTTEFTIPVESALTWDGWNETARESLKQVGEGLHIRTFVERYFTKVEDFYIWLWECQTELHNDEIEAANILRDRAKAMHDERA